jgi:hypothetical protein
MFSGGELDSKNSFRTFGRPFASYPCHLHQAVLFQFNEAPIMWMASPVTTIFEEKRSVDFRHHHQLAGFGKPTVESFRPCFV